jgi:hypothetical protein
MGQTRVDLRHLLEDLADAYPGSLEESILVEIVANALDSGAALVRFRTDHAARTLLVVDDGRGMSRRELSRYHDLATTSKQRGKGIGFAGVGIKLGLLACDEVTTETRSARSHAATSWHLASKHKAPWRWIEPDPSRLGSEVTGTAVTLRPANVLSPLLDGGYIEHVLTEHYRPLFEAAFDGILAGFYPGGVRFEVNGRARAPPAGGGGGGAPTGGRSPACGKRASGLPSRSGSRGNGSLRRSATCFARPCRYPSPSAEWG